MPNNSIFLSGWEYNRLLYDDPLASRNSGIPAQVLWNGCAQFWLFEKVYVTEEAYSGDVAAEDELGWSSGYIFWPAPGSEDTELGVFMELKVGHGEAEVHAGVQA